MEIVTGILSFVVFIVFLAIVLGVLAFMLPIVFSIGTIMDRKIKN